MACGFLHLRWKVWLVKKAKKWKQCLQHFDKSLSHYILSCSSVSLSQQSISANNANRDVVDNTDMSHSGSSQASFNQSASVSSGLNTPISQAQQQGSFTATTRCTVFAGV